ncbi:hypothetical protein [Methylomagnum sp.]
MIAYLAICAATLLAQFGLVSLTFPLSELLGDQPLLYYDSPYHWYRMTLAVNLTNTDHGIGYDPFFGAGYRAGGNMDPSANLLASLAIYLRPWWDAFSLYKGYVFVMAVLGPLCVPLAAGLMRLSVAVVALASGLGVMLWWASYSHWYHTAGMVAYVAASYMALPFIALLLRLPRKTSWLSAVALGLFGAFGLFYHIAFPIPVAFWMVAWLAFNGRQTGGGALVLMLLVVPAIALLPNLPWLTTAFGEGFRNTYAYQSTVDISLVWRELLGQWDGSAHGCKLYAPLALSLLWGCFAANSGEAIRLCRVAAVSGFALIVFAAVGAAIGALQPNRLVVAGYLLMCIPAPIGLLSLMENAKRASSSALRIAARASLVLIFGGILYAANEVRREVSYADIGHYGKRPPEVTGVGPYSTWIMDFLRRETNPSGRVLFELSGNRIYDNANMAAYYAYMSDREFIGGPYIGANFGAVRWANFGDGRLFGQPIDTISGQVLEDRLSLYNIGWVMAHSDASKRHLDALPFLVAVEDFKQYRAYRVNRPLGFFHQGRGVVSFRGHNRIALTALAGDEVILKYHYVQGLKADPEAALSPVMLDGDPDPFIKISRPPPDLQLWIP